MVPPSPRAMRTGRGIGCRRPPRARLQNSVPPCPAAGRGVGLGGTMFARLRRVSVQRQAGSLLRRPAQPRARVGNRPPAVYVARNFTPKPRPGPTFRAGEFNAPRRSLRARPKHRSARVVAASTWRRLVARPPTRWTRPPHGPDSGQPPAVRPRGSNRGCPETGGLAVFQSACLGRTLLGPFLKAAPLRGSAPS